MLSDYSQFTNLKFLKSIETNFVFQSIYSPSYSFDICHPVSTIFPIIFMNYNLRNYWWIFHWNEQVFKNEHNVNFFFGGCGFSEILKKLSRYVNLYLKESVFFFRIMNERRNKFFNDHFFCNQKRFFFNGNEL